MDKLAHHVEFDVYCVAGLLATETDDFLGVLDEHDGELDDFASGVVGVICELACGGQCAAGGRGYVDERETGSVERDVALGDEVGRETGWEGKRVGRVGQSEREGECVAGGHDRPDERGGINVALDKVASEPCVRIHGALAVDLVALLQLAKVGLLERLGRHADLKVPRSRVKLGHRETGAIDGDAVTDVAVLQDGLALANRNAEASAAGLGRVE